MLNLTREQGALLLLIVFLALCIVLLFLGRTTPEERRAAGIGNPEDDNEPLRPVNAPQGFDLDSEIDKLRAAGYDGEATGNGERGDCQGDVEIELTPNWKGE